MDLRKRSYKKKINLENMSDEQLLEFMDSVESSVESEDESFDSDDSICDQTYILNNIEADTWPENTEQAIAECVHNMGVAETTDAFVEGLNFSLNFSAMDIPSAYSTFFEDEAAVEIVVPQEPSESTAAKIPNKYKRVRSPLPTAEATGPLV